MNKLILLLTSFFVISSTFALSRGANLERVPVGTRIKILKDISIPAWKMYNGIYRTNLGEDYLPVKWSVKVKSSGKDRYIAKGLVLTVTGVDVTQTCNNKSRLGGKYPIYRIKFFVSHPQIEYIKYESGVSDKELHECLWHSGVANYMMDSYKSGNYFDMY